MDRSTTPIEIIKSEYEASVSLYHVLIKEFANQINALLEREGIVTLFPVDARVKGWASVKEKIQRKESVKNIETLTEIKDIAGIRIVLLYKKDVEKVCILIKEYFEVLNVENTEDRLSDNQFGYGSIHFEVTPKESWCEVPTLSMLRGLIAEIQVRTGSQHIWAAASHTLQYKKEQHVPIPLRRSISRVAALLETVDLEFARVLDERVYYRDGGIASTDTLNIDNLRLLLDKKLPIKNKSHDEDYAEVYDELLILNVNKINQLEAIIDRHLESALEEDRGWATHNKEQADSGFSLYYLDTTIERIMDGVYLSHVGLLRDILHKEYGEEYRIKRMEVDLSAF
ncbi:GTP pyrophosphokinase family protein [Brevibacillus sp. NPDC058079]|uniref:GTP pyrophosphokinase n=1 Tax=Brevibacillus sp. NPDC058079 TaxID=3346330 RepID=UPI0036E37061